MGQWREEKSDMTVKADAAGTFRIGGELEVARLGYGAMRLTGQPGNWGPYPDPAGGIGCCGARSSSASP